VAAQDSGAVVRPQVSTLDIGQGQVETINVILENAQDVYAVDVSATFDPAIVEVVDSDPAREGVQIIPGPFPQPDFLVRNIADNEAGTLRYVTTQVSPTLPMTGAGVVFSVQFRGKVLGQQSALVIESVQLADRHGVKLAVSPQDGVLNIVPPKPPTPTAVASATPTVEVSPTPETVVAHAATPSPAKPDAVPVEATNASPPFSPLLLGLAVGGGLGAVVLAGMAFVMLRRPLRRQSSKRKQDE
jgi:hypothetical protein